MKPTEAQIEAFKTKMAAHRKRADELARAVEEAPDKRAMLQAARALVQHYDSLYPCEHGQDAANGCIACDILYRAVYGYPADDGFGGPVG